MTGEINHEIAGIDLRIANDLLIDDDAGAGTETTVTGETNLMRRLEDAARTLLTLGPVAEVKPPENPQLEKAPKFLR